MDDQLTYSIRDLEELSGIPAHTIRTWERRYNLFSPSRDAGNVRCYDARDISHLHHLVMLLKQGHRISTLAGKSWEEISALAKESTLISKDSDVTETLCLALQDFDAMKVESLMNCYIRKEGFDHAVFTRFVPFLDQMSFLLLSGVLQPVHAQLFYTVLRQKVNSAIDVIIPSRESARWVLVNSDDMTDTVYGDIMHYLLRKGGRQVISVGSTTPEVMQVLLKDLKSQGYCFVAGGEEVGEWLQKMLTIIPNGQMKQGNTLVLIPGKTLDFVNNSQINGGVILVGLQEAFKHLLDV
ncbi:MAG TPA: MerR family transcriptional regulator [Saprospiraceae bacterium]|nr:MerR family transcriptional regulator [Saprospiraceae bacterium]